jgi:hypothetical protein
MADEVIGGGMGAATPVPPPQAFLDAGGGDWTEVERIVRRRMDELAIGDVLEVSGLQPGIEADLRSWCGDRGHDLALTIGCGKGHSLRLKKVKSPSPPGRGDELGLGI